VCIQTTLVQSTNYLSRANPQMNYLLQRRQALINNLKKYSLDAILVTTPVNVTYLTGFTGDSSFVVVTSKHNILVSDTRFEEQIKEECPEIEAIIRGHNKTTYEATAEVLTKAGVKSIGVEENRITLGELEALKQLAPKVTFVPVNGLLELQRVIKDPSETE